MAKAYRGSISWKKLSHFVVIYYDKDLISLPAIWKHKAIRAHIMNSLAYLLTCEVRKMLDKIVSKHKTLFKLLVRVLEYN